MLPHTDLFLLWKVALQMRIRRRLKMKQGGFKAEFGLVRFGCCLTTEKLCGLFWY